MPARDPMSAAAHAEHDTLLVAQLAGGDPLDEGRQAEASALVARCSECASLASDLRAVSGAVAWEPVPPRRRDFRISAAQAEAARGSRLQRFLGRLVPPDTRRLQPLAAGVLSLGLLLMVAGTAWPDDAVPLAGAGPAGTAPELVAVPSPEGRAEIAGGRENARDQIVETFDQPAALATAPAPAVAEPPDLRFRADGQSGAEAAAGAAVEEEQLDKPDDIAQEAIDGAGLEAADEVESNAFFSDADAAAGLLDEIGDDAIDPTAQSLQQRAAKASRPGVAADPDTPESDVSDLRAASAAPDAFAEEPAAPLIEPAEVDSASTDMEVGNAGQAPLDRAAQAPLDRAAAATLVPRLSAAAGEGSAASETESALVTTDLPVDEGIGIETWLLVSGLVLALLGLALSALAWFSRRSRRDPYRS